MWTTTPISIKSHSNPNPIPNPKPNSAVEFLRDFSVPDDVHQEYDLFLRNDLNTAGNIQWYYFSATTPESQTCTYPLRIRFNIVNMQKKDALYNYGMRPVSYSVAQASEWEVGWIHAGYDICYYKNGRTIVKNSGVSKEAKKKISNLYSLSFTYTFSKPDTVFFAHCYPYTYSTLKDYLNSLCLEPTNERIMKRRLLTHSLLGNRCDLLTVTAPVTDPSVRRE